MEDRAMADVPSGFTHESTIMIAQCPSEQIASSL